MLTHGNALAALVRHPGDYCPMTGGMMDGGMMNGMMGSTMMQGMAWPSWILWVAFQISLLALLMLLVVYVAKLIWGKREGQLDAFETLKLRYTQGSLTAQEYKRLKRELQKG